MIAITAAAALGQGLSLYYERVKLRSLAGQWQMHYAPGDRLRLAARVAERFAVPGACNVRVRDLMFRTTGNQHQYLFTVEYGVGVVRGKRRRRRVAGFSEPVTRGGRAAHGCDLLVGTMEVCLLAQYEEVYKIVNEIAHPLKAV
jgi:hypothetical protein